MRQLIALGLLLGALAMVGCSGESKSSEGSAAKTGSQKEPEKGAPDKGGKKAPVVKDTSP